MKSIECGKQFRCSSFNKLQNISINFLLKMDEFLRFEPCDSHIKYNFYVQIVVLIFTIYIIIRRKK